MLSRPRVRKATSSSSCANRWTHLIKRRARSARSHPQNALHLDGLFVLTKFRGLVQHCTHRHPVRELVAFSSDVRTDVRQRELCLNAGVERVGGLDELEVLDVAAALFPSSFLPTGSPLCDTADRVARVAEYLNAGPLSDLLFGEHQGLVQGCQFRRVIRAGRVVEAIPKLRDEAVPVD